MQTFKIGVCLGLIGLDQLVSASMPISAANHARYFHFFSQPVSFAIGGGVLILLSSLYTKNWRALIFLWAGFISNSLSFMFHHRIKDYIPTGISFLNLADLYIVVGLLLLLGSLNFFD